MAFTSVQYILFFLISCFVFFIIPKKIRVYWLLICSYYFYMSWNAKYAILMFISTIVTYLSGILISKCENRKKLWVLLSILINIGILFVFKYYTFFISSINSIFKLTVPSSLNLLLPVGISFYTFQALSYTIDVYRKKVDVQKNFFKYALFVSFFPQLVAGPIEKSHDLLSQFDQEKRFNWDNLHYGLLLITIGFFYKLVIADRAAIVVNHIYNNVGYYANGGGLYYIIATFLFAIQIYFDFNAYSTIARGSAKVLGYDLSINFKRPYFAKSVKDFWHRWHISLSSWFKEYLYIPLGGNKKGKLRTQINILIVFLISGLWHGAAWTFVIWGLLHGLFQVIENIIYKKSFPNEKLLVNIIHIIITFILVDFAWIFFRSNTLNDAFLIVRNIFNLGMIKSFSLLGISKLEFIILFISIFVIFIIELLSEKYDLYKWFIKRNVLIRWIFYYVLLFVIILFGIYGPGFSIQEFIYFQF